MTDIKHPFSIKNENSIKSTTEALQKALDKIVRDNSEPSQELLCSLANVSRSNLRHYKWAKDEIGKLKKQWKDKKLSKNNLVKFEPIENKLRFENSNYRQQNTEYFNKIHDLEQQVSKLTKENLLIIRDRDELKLNHSTLKSELNRLKNSQELKVINLRKV